MRRQPPLITDVKSQKYGYQRGLDTLVVHTVTDECYMSSRNRVLTNTFILITG